MENYTLDLLGFHLKTLRRTPRSVRQILAAKAAQLKPKSFGQIGEYFAQFIPGQHLRPTQTGALSRGRFFNKENVFWVFFSQVQAADGGYQDVVRKLRALRQWETHLNQAKINNQERHRLIGLLDEPTMGNIIPEGLERSEPRAVKQRPEPFPLLTAPWHEIKVAKRQGKLHVKTA